MQSQLAEAQQFPAMTAPVRAAISTSTIDTKKTALIFVQSKPHLFHADFMDWLNKNFAIWVAFEKEANRLWVRGRRDYAARTIVEWMRHETALSEKDGEFKINNNYVPSLARLWECHYPGREGFFKKRSESGDV